MWRAYTSPPSKDPKTGLIRVCADHVDWNNEGPDFLTGNGILRIDEAASLPLYLLVRKTFNKRQLAVLTRCREEMDLLKMTESS
jgi:hypothetical protein